MKKILITAALTVAAATASLGSATAASADPGPCDVQDAPNADFDGRTVSVDLHTQAECFGTPVSVG